MSAKQLILMGTIFGVAIFNTACTMTQKSQRCNPNYAFNRGYGDATSGDLSRSGALEGQICDETYRVENFRKDYLAGFQKRKDELCNEEAVRRLAREDAEIGHEQAELESMNICFEGTQNRVKFKQIYRQTFTETFCSPARASKVGQAHAKAYAPVHPEIFQGKCIGNSKELAEKAYQQAYQAGLQSACMLTNVYAQGTEDAQAHRDISVEIKKLLVCPSVAQKEILEFYSKAFNDALKAMMEKERLNREKERLENEKERLEIEKKQLLELEDQRYRDRERLEVEKRKLFELENQRDKHKR